jgi:hypothetical protein
MNSNKKANVKIAAIFKSTGPLCYCQQHDSLTIGMKAFKVTMGRLISTIVPVRKRTANFGSVCSASGLEDTRSRTNRTKILQGILLQHK